MKRVLEIVEIVFAFAFWSLIGVVTTLALLWVVYVTVLWLSSN